MQFNEEEGADENLSDTNAEELDETIDENEPETFDVCVGTEDLGKC